MEIDLANLPDREAHDILTGGLIPRPIAWVSSVDVQGRVNLAPFSFFSGVTWNPPTLSISVVNRSDGTLKDTVVNIKATGNFVVNMVTEDMAARMVATASTLPHGVNEAEKADVPMIPSSVVTAPRVAHAKVAFECALDRIVTVGHGAGAGNLILGTIEIMHVSDDVFNTGASPDWTKLDVIGRLSGTKFLRVQSTFDVEI